MKQLTILLAGLIFLSFLACKKTALIPSNQPVDTDIVSFLDHSNRICVYIKYKDKINGFDVSAVCFVDTCFADNPEEIWGRGFISFSNESTSFMVYNNSLTDNTLRQNDIPLKNGMTVEADYVPYSLPDKDNMLFNTEVPLFLFFDIDFDGRDELIVTRYGEMFCHGHHAYDVYELDENESHFLFPKSEKPFNQINDYTEIDTVARTITLSLVDGGRYFKQEIYGMVDEKYFDEELARVCLGKKLKLIGVEKYNWENCDKEGCPEKIYYEINK